MQRTFSPIDFGFSWTADWYTWDAVAGRKAALKARNDHAKALRREGWTVTKFSLPGQLVSRGGIGSGHPQIEEVVTVFGLNARR